MTQPPPPDPYSYPPPPGGPPHPAPPYGPPQQSRPRGRTSSPLALGATAVWGAVHLVLVMSVGLSAVGADAFDSVGYVIGQALANTLLASIPVWLITRRRASSFWILVLIALPCYLVLRVISAVGAR